MLLQHPWNNQEGFDGNQRTESMGTSELNMSTVDDCMNRLSKAGFQLPLKGSRYVFGYTIMMLMAQSHTLAC
jgi:hypothetical protein